MNGENGVGAILAFFFLAFANGMAAAFVIYAILLALMLVVAAVKAVRDINENGNKNENEMPGATG